MHGFRDSERHLGLRLHQQRLVVRAAHGRIDVDSALNGFHSRDPGGPATEVVERADARGGQRRALRVSHYNAEVGLPLARKLLEEVIAPSRLRAGRQHADVAIGDLNLQDGRGK